jgi:hypothetical protein
MLCLRNTVGALVLLGALVGCKSDRSSPPVADTTTAATPSTATATVTATDYAFQGPDKLSAGANILHLVNQGKEPHQLQLIKLEDGKTVDDLKKALKTPGPIPSWVKFVGGPNGILGGGETRATAELAPGNYAYICLIPSPDGIPHAAKGMVRPFVVEGDSAASTAELQTDVTIKLADYDFQTSKPLASGQQKILVQNAGPQPHEILLVKMPPGKKIEDFARWAETGLKGAPPGEPLGGVAVLDKGGEGRFTVELAPGDYGLICFVPDMKDGKPHLAHGMMKNFKVS